MKFIGSITLIFLVSMGMISKGISNEFAWLYAIVGFGFGFIIWKIYD